jgi:RNA polymerase sigma-70 factor (ECF subfamily)
VPERNAYHGDVDLVEQAWQQCRATRPDVQVTLDQFRAHLDAHRPAEVTLDEQIRSWCLDDVYLVCGAIAGHPAAIAAIEREIIPIIDLVIASYAPSVIDETRQRLRAMLMVDHGGRGPLLAQYGGRGALRRWIRVVAAREAGKTWRADTAALPVDDDALFDALAPPTDPVLSAVKRNAALAFKAAFVTSLGELERRDRTILRLHILDGLSIDEIAPMYSVHRATIARWIAAAKDLVLDKTRRALMRDLRIDAHEVDSLIQFVQSRIDLSSKVLD